MRSPCVNTQIIQCCGEKMGPALSRKVAGSTSVEPQSGGAGANHRSLRDERLLYFGVYLRKQTTASSGDDCIKRASAQKKGG